MAERASDELEQLRMLAQRVAATPASRIPDQFSPTSPPSGTVLSPPHISVMPHIDDSSGIQVKIADMGNATSSRFHFTDNIQTRQYRAPEVIIGRSDWNTKVDMWSVACLVSALSKYI
jgi:serine/threonine protein kinase